MWRFCDPQLPTPPRLLSVVVRWRACPVGRVSAPGGVGEATGPAGLGAGAITMVWLTRDGDYLLEGAGASLPDWARVAHGHGGEPVRPAAYYLVTPGGEVRQAFSGPIAYGLDDERGLSDIHAVSGDTLVSYHV